MRVVVTGGMGFIGTSVVEKLISGGHEVIMVDFAEDLLRTYEKHSLPILKRVYRNLADCMDLLHPYELFNDDLAVDRYIHLGACVDTLGVPDDLFEKNIRYMRTLVNWLPYNAHVTYASSAAVYGTGHHPCNAYGMSKRMGENILSSRKNIHTTALRFFNVFGRDEHHKTHMASVPFKIANAYHRIERFQLFCPDASRDFISVSDVSKAVVGHALAGKQGQQAFDVGSGTSTRFDQLDELLQKQFIRASSICDNVPIPEKYVGRYQSFTRAGMGAAVSPYIDKMPLVVSLNQEFSDA